MKVYTSNKESVTLADKPIASGGEGKVYDIINQPARFAGKICAKVYLPEKLTDGERERKVKYMAQNPPKAVQEKFFTIAWPLDYIEDDRGKFIGFIMPKAPAGSEQLTVLTTPFLSKKMSLDWHSRYDRSGNGVHLLNRMKLMGQMTMALSQIHNTGKYVLKDFKPQNVLILPTGNVTIADMDSLQICDNGRLLFRGTVATKEYIPPEYYTKGVGTKKEDILPISWDLFAIGVVFYQLLLGLHPYTAVPARQEDDSQITIVECIKDNLFPFGPNASKILRYPEPHNKYRYLPPKIQQAFVKTFSGNPAQRPSMMEWKAMLKEVVMQLVANGITDTPK